MDTPDNHRDQVPVRIEPNEHPSRWRSSEISRMVTTPMTSEQAAKLVSRLLGGYPSLNLHDPETYIASVTALLCGFSWWVGERAIERVSTESKFVPSKAEVAAACQHFNPSPYVRTWGDDWDARSQAQLAERERREALPPPPKQTMEELREEMRARGVNMGGPVAHRETEATVKAKLGLTDEQWAALPDADLGKWQRVCDAHRTENSA